VGNKDDGRAVGTSIRNGSCLAISDGSFKDQHGTASWTVQGEDSFGALGSSLITPGNPEDQSAYRSELAGLFGIATIVNLLCQHYDIAEGTVIIGCDGLQALLHAISSVDFTSTKMAQFDLVGATRTMLRRSPVSWKAEHVLGHQEDDDVHATLDRKAMMNVTMDGEAKFHWLSTVSQAQKAPSQQHIDEEPWSLWIGDVKVCAQVYDSVANAISGKVAAQYWDTNKQCFDPHSSADVNWDAMEMAMKSQPRTRQQWISKHTTAFCSVGKMMLRQKEWPNSNCPRCQVPEESTTHVWKCPDPEANSLLVKYLRQLKYWMLTQWTPVLLAQTICERLSAWRSNTVPTLKATPHSQLVKVLELQDAMGWQSFFEGAPALGWSGYMDLYYNSIRSNRNGQHRWLSSIIKKLWKIAWDL
jgi:hypothetical protein